MRKNTGTSKYINSITETARHIIKIVKNYETYHGGSQTEILGIKCSMHDAQDNAHHVERARQNVRTKIGSVHSH
jgi:hypothetical protein